VLFVSNLFLILSTLVDDCLQNGSRGFKYTFGLYKYALGFEKRTFGLYKYALGVEKSAFGVEKSAFLNFARRFSIDSLSFFINSLYINNPLSLFKGLWTFIQEQQKQLKH
jgi:hypothetical protein